MNTLKECIKIITDARKKDAHSFSLESGVSCFYGNNKQATILILNVPVSYCDALLDCFPFMSDDRD